MTIIGKAIAVENAKVEKALAKVKSNKDATKAEIMEKLTELGIEFDKNANKAQLTELLPANEEEE